MTASDFTRGIRENQVQVAHQLIQVMLVGFAIGMTRTVVPALAESEFGLERGSFLLLTSFVVAFGTVKAVMNCRRPLVGTDRPQARAILGLGRSAADPGDDLVCPRLELDRGRDPAAWGQPGSLLVDDADRKA